MIFINNVCIYYNINYIDTYIYLFKLSIIKIINIEINLYFP